MINPVTAMLGDQRTIPMTIAASDATGLSAGVKLENGRPVRLHCPAAWDTAAMTFMVSHDGINYADLYDEYGSEISYQPVAGKSMRIPVIDFIGVGWLKIRSGTSAAPVTQTADRAFTLVVQY